MKIDDVKVGEEYHCDRWGASRVKVLAITTEPRRGHYSMGLHGRTGDRNVRVVVVLFLDRDTGLPLTHKQAHPPRDTTAELEPDGPQKPSTIEAKRITALWADYAKAKSESDAESERRRGLEAVVMHCLEDARIGHDHAMFRSPGYRRPEEAVEVSIHTASLERLVLLIGLGMASEEFSSPITEAFFAPIVDVDAER